MGRSPPESLTKTNKCKSITWFKEPPEKEQGTVQNIDTNLITFKKLKKEFK